MSSPFLQFENHTNFQCSDESGGIYWQKGLQNGDFSFHGLLCLHFTKGGWTQNKFHFWRLHGGVSICNAVCLGAFCVFQVIECVGRPHGGGVARRLVFEEGVDGVGPRERSSSPYGNLRFWFMPPINFLCWCSAVNYSFCI